MAFPTLRAVIGPATAATGNHLPRKERADEHWNRWGHKVSCKTRLSFDDHEDAANRKERRDGSSAVCDVTLLHRHGELLAAGRWDCGVPEMDLASNVRGPHVGPDRRRAAGSRPFEIIDCRRLNPVGLTVPTKTQALHRRHSTRCNPGRKQRHTADLHPKNTLGQVDVCQNDGCKLRN